MTVTAMHRRSHAEVFVTSDTEFMGGNLVQLHVLRTFGMTLLALELTLVEPVIEINVTVKGREYDCLGDRGPAGNGNYHKSNTKHMIHPSEVTDKRM